tara:strand:- start:11044 stop:11250 length:207 start_codon:yes stop_codon:yes gene_type:complete
MEVELDRYLNLDIGNVKVSVKLEEDGVVVDVLSNKNKIGFSQTSEIITSKSKSYADFGLEVKEVEDDD